MSSLPMDSGDEYLVKLSGGEKRLEFSVAGLMSVMFRTYGRVAVSDWTRTG